jgi:hypothetical protein
VDGPLRQGVRGCTISQEVSARNANKRSFNTTIGIYLGNSMTPGRLPILFITAALTFTRNQDAMGEVTL